MTKFGQLIATDVWAATARALTDFSAEEIFDLPALTFTYPAVAATSSATANTFGSWAELVADVGAGKRLIIVQFAPYATGGGWSQVEIGEGESGSESVITTISAAHLMQAADSGNACIVFYVWRTLTDNARLSARVKDSFASALAHYICVGYA